MGEYSFASTRHCGFVPGFLVGAYKYTPVIGIFRSTNDIAGQVLGVDFCPVSWGLASRMRCEALRLPRDATLVFPLTPIR
jgi:hypothetical protein